MADDDDLRARVRALEEALTTTQARLDNLLADSWRAPAPAASGRCATRGNARRAAAAPCSTSAPSARSRRRGSPVPVGLAHEERWTGATPRAPLEAFACRACKLVELHAIDFDRIVIDGERIVAIEPEPDAPSGGPYR